MGRSPHPRVRALIVAALALSSPACLTWENKDVLDSGIEGGDGGSGANGNTSDGDGNPSGNDGGGSSGASTGGNARDGGASSGGGTSCSTIVLCNGEDDDCDNVFDERCVSVGKCIPSPCKNGGTCVEGTGTFTCNCGPAFEGPTCELVKNKCAPNPCMNGGTCTESAGSVTCSCKAGYEGNRCQVVSISCSPNPCHNGGTCSSASGTGVCTCAKGFAGRYCQTNLDECSPNPCLNGGTCVDGAGTYTCSCPEGKGGLNCESNVCGDVEILNAADLEAAKMCGLVRNLTLGSTTSDMIEFPNLTVVTGYIAIRPPATAPSIGSVSFPRLVTVGSSLLISHTDGAAGAVKRYAFEALREIRGPLSILNIAGTKELDFPSLESVGSALQLSNAKDLCSARFGKLARAGGIVSLANLPKVSAAAKSTLEQAAAKGGHTATSSVVACCDTSGASSDCASQPYVPGSAACSCDP